MLSFPWGVNNPGSMGQGGGAVTQNVTPSFAKIAFEYKPQKADGSLDAGIHFS